MRCVVTGASGFLGKYVTQSLLDRGIEVAVLVRGDIAIDNVQLIRGDLRFPDSYRDGFLGFKPEAVIHLAWGGVGGGARNDPAQADNIPATLRLVEIAAQAGAKHFINAGSQAEYGPLNRVIRETDPTLPTTLYGHCKLDACVMAQQVCAEHDIRFAHLRVFSTYGPYNPSYWMIPYLITELKAGRKPSLTHCEQKWDFLYAADAGDAFAEVLLNPKATGIFNLGSGTAPPLRKTVEMIRDLINPALPLGFGEVPYRGDQVMHLEADISRLKNTTRWQPRVTLQKGLEQTVHWYAKQH